MIVHLHPTASSTAPTPPVPRPVDEATVLEFGLDDLEVGTTRLAKIDGHRVCVARTDSGVHAVDHACPHEGYGLTQGQLDGELLTCAWHNWKFDVSSGDCVVGEEAVPTHEVEVADDGAIAVRLRRPDPAAERERLLTSLRRGIERDYVGQIARDVARLLRLGVDPATIATVGVEHGAGRNEWGWGHSIAALTDALAMVPLFEADERAIPLVQGLSFVSETSRDRPECELPEPSSTSSRATFCAAVEREDLEAAQAEVLGALRRGADADELHAWFVGPIAAHHLSYGHGAIYAQKAFELLDAIGWSSAPLVLGHLVTSIVTGTREDVLPYHRPFGREVDTIDLDELADRVVFDEHPAQAVDGQTRELRDALLGPDRASAARAALDALSAGVPVDVVIDVLVDVAAERLLRHDPSVDGDLDDDFGWLDVTHGLTYPHAIRYHVARTRRLIRSDRADLAASRRELVELILHGAFQANWTGRHEWHTEVGPVIGADDLDAAPEAIHERGIELQRRSLDDQHSVNIHVVHAVKTSRAAAIESARSGDPRIIAATARYFDGPRQERSVRAITHRSIEFVAGRLQR